MASLALGGQEGNLDMLGVHSKHGFKVEALQPKTGGRVVQGSSVPLILPNDLKYDASTGKVVKMRGVRRQTLQIVPEALALLEGIEEPVSTLAICGPCRSGKSYILSRLLGSADAFELGHRMDPKTFGIWMGTSVLRGKDFTIVLLDTEGIDAAASRANQDAGILVMTILMSSLLIYNSLNVPYKGDLEKMQCFIKLAKGIAVKKDEKTESTAYSEFFPDFLWLLRDVALKPTDRNGKEITPTEYLITRVLDKEEEEDDCVEEESTSDKVGRAILTFFSSVHCAILERPSEKSAIMNNIAEHTGSLNPEFNKGVEDLIDRLLTLSHAKRGYYKGSTVNGVALSIMTKQYVEAVNDPKAIPNLDNTWKNTIELMRNRAIDEVVVEYNQQMQTAVKDATEHGKVPLEETAENGMESSDQPTLMDIHHQVFDIVTAMLLEKIGHLGVSSKELGSENKTVVDQMQQRLIQGKESSVDYKVQDGTTMTQEGFVVTGGELFRYIQENKDLSRKFCQNLSNSLLQPIRECVDSPPADYDFQQLTGELSTARQKYKKQARGPEKWVVLQELTKNFVALEKEIEKIKGYQRKLMDEQKRAHKAEVDRMEEAQKVQKLYNQKKDLQRAHRGTLKKMFQQHEEQIKKIKEEAEKRQALEQQKIKDLEMANREKQAEMNREIFCLQIVSFIEEFNEKQSSQWQKMMEGMQKKHEKETKEMRELITTMRPKTPPQPQCKFWSAWMDWAADGARDNCTVM
ncbi:Guanylate-binding protein 5 [Branchiostoma belcheri]|nr:Guanylate-binding protein 5 [Branchiostoma belcheri]